MGCADAYLDYYECAIDVTCAGSDDYEPCTDLYAAFYDTCGRLGI